MGLGSFIEEHHNGSQRAFAAACGIDPGQLSRYLAAERGEPEGQRPGADNIARIEKATGGLIGASHWLELRERQERKLARAARQAGPPVKKTSPLLGT